MFQELELRNATGQTRSVKISPKVAKTRAGDPRHCEEKSPSAELEQVGHVTRPSTWVRALHY